MKRFLSFILAVVLFCSIFSVAAVNTSAKSNTVNLKVRIKVNYSFENEVFRLVNIERQKRNIPKLKMSKHLFNYAQLRVAELAVCYRYPQTNKPHIRPDGTKAVAYKGVSNENSAVAYDVSDYSPKEIVKGWMSSSGHRKSILNRNYKTIGIGVAVSGRSSFWVQDFDTANTKTNYSKTGSQIVAKNVKMNKSICHLYVETPCNHWFDSETKHSLPKQFYVYTSVNSGYSYFDPKVDYNSVTYTSSNKSIATVNSKGFVSFKKPGTVKITSYLKNTSLKATKSFSYYAKPLSAKLNRTAFVYNGKDQRPSVTNAITNSNYAGWIWHCALPKASKIVGDYNVYTYIFKPEFEDDTNEQFLYTPDEDSRLADFYDEYIGCTSRYTIIPKSTKISALKSGKGNASVYWSKQAQQTSGYLLQYSTRKDFKTSKTVKITSNAKTGKVIKNLNRGKVYYFRIRTYKAKSLPLPEFEYEFIYGYPDDFNYLHNYYNLSYGNYVKNYYSTWSATKSLKIK